MKTRGRARRQDRFLLQDDGDRLVAQAKASAVLSADAESSAQNQAIARKMRRATIR
jgi:hypothetical protein